MKIVDDFIYEEWDTYSLSQAAMNVIGDLLQKYTDSGNIVFCHSPHQPITEVMKENRDEGFIKRSTEAIKC